MISRAELAELYREDDRRRAEHAEQKGGANGVCVQREAPVGDLLYRTTDNVLEPASEPEESWGEWEAWMAGHLRNAREEMFDVIAEAMNKLVDQERAAADKQRVALQEEISGLTTVLNEVRRQYAEQVETLRRDFQAQIVQVEQERVIREQAAVEARNYVADIRRQAAAEHVELEKRRVDDYLAERDSRIKQLEVKMDMLCRFLSVSGVDLPKGL
jgi:hypothetical protein